MRVLLLPLALVLLLPASILAQGTTSTPETEATVVIQTAITALGGATAIGQTHNWSFQAQLDGMKKGTTSDTLDTDAKPASATAPTGSATTVSGASPSPLLPTFAGALLLKESDDPSYVTGYHGEITVGSRTLVIVDVWLARNRFHPAQIWYFDKATGLPATIDFRLPARIGHFRTVRSLVELSDYRTISGVLYPFKIVTTVPGRPLPEVVTLQSITAGGAQ
jgi:hypothetical protein